jgi:Tol biopolymer transport system component
MQNNIWGNPVRLPEPINSAKDEFYPSIAKSGNIYFTTELTETKKEDIVVCYYRNGIYSKPEALSDSVNSTNAEFNAFVDPDERYIIYSSYGRKDNGGGDLYISYKNKNGEWGTARNLQPPINSSGIDYCPYVSPDGKYFFFTSNRSILTQPFKSKMDINELKKALNSAGNGLDDIYWMKFEEVLK